MAASSRAPPPSPPSLPVHFCHLGGLVLVPVALSSLVDAPPIRGMLQRRLFERTVYKEPSGRAPVQSALTPRTWPDLLPLTAEDERRVIENLRRLRRERPEYYPRLSGRHRDPRIFQSTRS